MNRFYRHGDVLLTRVEKAEGDPITHDGSYPLAFGEITGHKHLLTVKNPENMKITKVGNNLFICLMEVGTLSHEEHAKLEIDPGIYKMTTEREFDYCEMDMRTVAD